MKLKWNKLKIISIVFVLAVTSVGTLFVLFQKNGSIGDTGLIAAGAETKPVMRAALVNGKTAASFQAKPDRVPGMDKTAENDALALYMNKTTAELAVFDKRSGRIWYTNPQDRDKDSKASAFEKQGLASQLSMQFSDSNNNKKTFLSFNDAVDKKQFTIEPIADGVKIVYTLGDMSAGIDVLPKLISKERLDSLLAKLSKEKAKYVQNKFQLNDSKTVYKRFDDALKSSVRLQKVVDAFAEAGYTAEDLAADNKANASGASSDSEKVVFSIPVAYTLDGDNLVATVIAAELKEPKKTVITDINLLPYLSAAGLSDKGYMFVPDGSGSLIYLNNGKFSDDIYSQPVYGADEAIRKRLKPQHTEGIRLPVFGIKVGDSAMYGIIEKGEALASINAEVSGRANSYNYIYGSFKLRSWDELPMSNGQSFNYVQIMQQERNNEDLSIRYGFLYGEEANYAGIAKSYQQYLVNASVLKQEKGGTDLPFYVDIVGDIPKQKSILGVPYEAMEPLTTFSEAEQIAKEMKDGDIDNIHMRYLGWFNDGVNHELPDGISVDRKLGGRSGLAELNTYLKETGSSLYPDAAFLDVYHDTWGFSPAKDASRYITRRIIEKYPYDAATERMAPYLESSYLLSPAKLPPVVDGFLKDYSKLGINGLSLREMGNHLNPDYRINANLDRQKSANVISGEMSTMSKVASDILVSGGNAYSLQFAKHIVDVPLTDTKFNITDETVPFYQMVVHGYVSYAGQPFNLADTQDIRYNLLKAMEYGANVRFTWIYQDDSKVKDTLFNNLYSTQYKSWMKEATSVYEEMNTVLKDVQYERMTGHIALQEGVYATTYESGKTIVVNYTDNAVQAGGQTVEPAGYIVLQHAVSESGRGNNS